jgi:hypothetical protein
MRQYPDVNFILSWKAIDFQLGETFNYFLPASGEYVSRYI